jgi:hypothetical protein
MANVHTLAITTIGMPESPTVRVINTASDRIAAFGLIGLTATAVGATMRSNRRAAIRDIMATEKFDPQSYLQAALEQSLRARSLVPVRVDAAPARDAFLPAVPPGLSQDALLDGYVSDYGFFAASDSDADPFRPSVTLHIQFVDARDNTVLMRDTVLISVGDGPAKAADNTDLGQLTFTTFSDVETNPKRAVTALRYALDQAAIGAVKRLG